MSTIEAEDIRGSSLELLENLLEPPLREPVLALGDDLPDEERLARAGAFHVRFSGTYEELLANHGLYRKLFEDQNESLLQSGLIPTARMGTAGEQRENGSPNGGATAPDAGSEIAAPAPA